MKRRRSERDGLEGDDEGFESSPEKVSEIEGPLNIKRITLFR